MASPVLETEETAVSTQCLGFSHASVGKESTCNAGEAGSIPGSGRSPEEGQAMTLQYSWASLVAPLVKNLPTMRETWVQSLGWEDPLEKGKATHSNKFRPGEFHQRCTMGLQRIGHD